MTANAVSPVGFPLLLTACPSVFLLPFLSKQFPQKMADLDQACGQTLWSRLKIREGSQGILTHPFRKRFCSVHFLKLTLICIADEVEERERDSGTKGKPAGSV